MENEVNKEFENLGTEIKKCYDNSLNSLNYGLLGSNISVTLIEVLNGTISMALLSAGFVMTGLTFVVGGTTTLIGLGVTLCATGPIGGIIGLGLMAFGIISLGLSSGISFPCKCDEAYSRRRTYPSPTGTSGNGWRPCPPCSIYRSTAVITSI